MEDLVIPDVMNDVFLPQGRYREHFVPISLMEVCRERGVKKWGTWRTLRVPDRRHGGQGHSWRHESCFFTPRKIPWKFHVDISIGSVSGRGCQEGGYLEDIEGSWLAQWMTEWFLMSWMMFFYPKEHILKMSGPYHYLLWSYKRSGSKEPTSEMRETRERQETRGSWSQLLPCSVAWRQGWGKGSPILSNLN